MWLYQIFLVIFCVGVNCRNSDDADYFSRFQRGARHGLAAVNSHSNPSGYTSDGISCIENDNMQVDMYTSEKVPKSTAPIVVLLDVMDTRNVKVGIKEVMPKSNAILIHVRLSFENVVRDVLDHASESQILENLQEVLVWVNKNANNFGGDKSRVTVVGLGPDGSLLVSLLSFPEENRHLLYGAVSEFGKHNVFTTDGIFEKFAGQEESFKMNPAPRRLLVGYESRLEGEHEIAAVVNFLEAFGNHGTRITLFQRNEQNTALDQLLRMSLEFSKGEEIDSKFPELKLGNWRSGLRVINWEYESWTVVTRTNLFEPRAADPDAFPLKNISLGTLRGRHLKRGEYEADGFYHIPFASPTSRFDYSSIVEPWNNLLDARYPVRYKDCTQNVFVNFGHEDCLNLHIWVPTVEKNLMEDPIPVMVFMHGGSFSVGTAGGFRIPGIDNALYEGTVMADFAEVIVVSVNYRLGALGFLNDGDLSQIALDGNYGIRDVVMAFEWVKKHIGEFGGDPNAVTLFGESAGAAGSGVLSLSPMMDGLIQRNIQQSGSPVSFFAVDFKPGVLANQVTTEMGCRSENYAKSRECLLQRDEFDFVGLNWPADFVPWRPTIDGIFLTEDPAVTLAKPSKLDTLNGFNSDEVYIMAAAVLPKFFTDLPINENDLQLFRQIIGEIVLKYPDRQEYIADIIFHNALQWKMDFSTQALKESIVRAASDFVFAAPAIRQALLRSETGSDSTNYIYNFDIKTKLRIFADWVYNSHAFELPYVFGEALRRTENDPLYNGTADLLSLQMMAYWTNFAKTGNPNLPMNDTISEIPWDEFTSADQAYMRLDFRMKAENLENNYRSHEIDLWNSLVPTLFQLDDESCGTGTITGSMKQPKKTSAYGLKTRPRKYRVNREVRKVRRSFTNDTECNLDGELVRNTTAGCVAGVLAQHDGVAVQSYLGIPYAEPPTGNLRFFATQSASSWGDKVLEANEYMPNCPSNSTLEGQDEDCLYLNIHRPNNAELLPVMVWIHPDMTAGNGGAMYDGIKVAATGNVVMVTFNYRVGVLGFLSAGGDTDAAGNFGLLDQNLALKWVKENIVNFGGDIRKITVFGDGDSSVAVGYHAVSNINDEQLFTNIIHQSGVGQLENNLPLDDADSAKEYASFMLCPVNSTTDMIACLRNALLDEIMVFSDFFEPKVVLDGTFMRDQPAALFENIGSEQKFKYLFAFTSGEGSLEYDEVISTVSDQETFFQYMNKSIVPQDEYQNPARIQALVEYEYMDFADDTLTNAQKLQRAAMDMSGDKNTIAKTMHLANITNSGRRILNPMMRNYVCLLTSPVDGEYPAWVGSPSGSFERLFWGLIDEPTPDIESLSTRVIRYWTTFAKNGRPFGLNDDDSWMRYTGSEGHYGELEAGSEFALHRQFPRPKYTSLWNYLIPLVDKPFPCDTPPPPIIPEVVMGDGVIVRGYSDRSADGRDYDVFRGLPYAEPPVGDLRFLDSLYIDKVAPSPGESVYSATLKKPRCLQTANGARGGYADEDCLYLDIWRPSAKLTSAPVLLWICHGGQSVKGPHSQLTDDGSCDIDGRIIALDGNLVFVKVQYRIGVFGFASAERSQLPGNAGLSDLENALKWVFSNIDSFGGSPDKVTLAGNGFGGTLAMVLGGLSESIAGGTVQNVIAQSGSLMSTWAYSMNPAADLEDLFVKAGCSDPPPWNTAVQCLRDLDALQLATLAGNMASVFPFGIYVRSENPTIDDRKKSFLDLKLGYQNDETIGSIQNWLKTKPVLMGVNGGAGYQFTVEAFPEIQTIFRRRPLTIEFIENMIDNDIYMDKFQLSYSTNESQILKEYYIPWGETDDGREIKRSAVRYQTESGFTRPMYDDVNVRMSDISEDTFVYVYQEKTTKRRARRWLNYGSDLGEEIPILFPGTQSEENSMLGSIMRQYWTVFVARGTPNGVGSDLGRWRSYNSENKNTMIFESSGHRVVSGYRDQAYGVWKSVFAPPPAKDQEPTVTSTIPTTTSCPVVVCPTCAPDLCPTSKTDYVIGTGIGLELTPEQADIAIEVLFGISLAFSCCLLLGILFYLKKARNMMKDSDSTDSLFLENTATKTGTYMNEKSQESISSSL